MIKCLVCRERVEATDLDKGFTCKNCTAVLVKDNLQLRDDENYNSYRSRVFGMLAVSK
jgi:hypothetical protein